MVYKVLSYKLYDYIKLHCKTGISWDEKIVFAKDILENDGAKTRVRKPGSFHS